MSLNILAVSSQKMGGLFLSFFLFLGFTSLSQALLHIKTDRGVGGRARATCRVTLIYNFTNQKTAPIGLHLHAVYYQIGKRLVSSV